MQLIKQVRGYHTDRCDGNIHHYVKHPDRIPSPAITLRVYGRCLQHNHLILMRDIDITTQICIQGHTIV